MFEAVYFLLSHGGRFFQFSLAPDVFFFIGLTSLFGRSDAFVFLRNENLEARRALRGRIYRPVGKDERRAGRDDCFCLVQEGS